MTDNLVSAIELFERTSADARVRTAHTLMSETNQNEGNALLEFEPSSVGVLVDTEAFRAITSGQREGLHAFTGELASAFAPEAWHIEVEARRTAAQKR